MTIEERAQEHASKKARRDEHVNVADSLGWRVMDPKKERLVMREKDTERQFGELFMPRNHKGLIDIWDKLATPEALEELGCDFEEKPNCGGPTAD